MKTRIAQLRYEKDFTQQALYELDYIKEPKISWARFFWIGFCDWVRHTFCRHKWTEEVRLNGPGPGPVYCTKCGKYL